MTVIKIKSFNLDHGIEIKALYHNSNIFLRADGLRGIFNRLEQIRNSGLALCFWQSLHPEERLTQELFSTANRISRNPESFAEELDKLTHGLERLAEITDKHSRLGPDHKVMPTRLEEGRLILALLKELDLFRMSASV